ATDASSVSAPPNRAHGNENNVPKESVRYHCCKTPPARTLRRQTRPPSRAPPPRCPMVLRTSFSGDKGKTRFVCPNAEPKVCAFSLPLTRFFPDLFMSANGANSTQRRCDSFSRSPRAVFLLFSRHGSDPAASPANRSANHRCLSLCPHRSHRIDQTLWRLYRGEGSLVHRASRRGHRLGWPQWRRQDDHASLPGWHHPPLQRCSARRGL